MHIAGWLVWMTYLVLGVAIASFSLVIRSQRLDVGETVAAVLLLGAIGALATLGLVVGSAIGLHALFTDRANRRVGSICTVLAGWLGAVAVAWLTWGFWMH
jgi:hypothetical protein